MEGEGAAETFEEHRKALFGHAYRMLGSVAEAEDAVQDAFLRWLAADRAKVENAKAFLTTTITRLCLDRIKSARSRREIYVGEWLPEPLVEDPGTPEMVANDVSVALMLALERLTPLERAAFLLHDVFDLGFEEVARALGREPAACRQLAARARAHVRTERPRYAAPAGEAERVAAAFFAALDRGDIASLRETLVDTALLHADGGGVRPSVLNPIRGADRIARFYAGLTAKGHQGRPRWERMERINGMPGRLTVERDGTLQTTALAIAEGRVAALYVVRNPHKLAHLAALVPPELRASLA